MKQLSTEAIILKRINFGEADRILTVLTSNSGQVSMLAKGVRKSKSKLAGGLELFSITDINYIDGKSDLKTIVSTRLKTHFKNIVSNVDRTMTGYDFMKLIDSYTQHSNEPEYFILLSSGLESLDNKTLPISLTEVWFYIKLLQQNGSGINLEKPLDSTKFTDEDAYEFSYDDMSFFVHKSGQFSPNHIKFLRLISKSHNPKQLVSINGYEALAGAMKTIIKQSAMMHKA
jgi:DNA repair protein RecO